MDPSSNNISVKLGVVRELFYSHKGIVTFNHEGNTQRALLRSRQVIYDGIPVAEDSPLEDYLPVGTEVYFKAHPFVDVNPSDMCQFYIISCWKRDEIDFPRDPSVEVFHGLCTQPCYFKHHGDGFGVAYRKENPKELIKFLYHNVFIKGERFREGLIGFKPNKEMQCDAVPSAIDPEEGTSWYANVVWRGKRPALGEGKEFKLEDDMAENIKQLTQSPRSIFIRTDGQILKILSREYAVALARIRGNEWHTVLFHSTSCWLQDVSLALVNLETVLQPGDKISLLAAKAPRILNYQWVASHVTPFKHASLAIV